jgi:3-hydroxy-9,10-secoandrosta-1,3,5(10)-triene-9,17-dione monooxygenase
VSTVESIEKTHHASGRPSVDELAARARALQPILRERAKETEANRRVSAETTATLAAADLFKLVKPKRFGGFEYGPSAVLRVGFELGQACGSTAWCTMLGNVNSLFASYWPLEAQTDVWGAEPGNLLAGTVVPTGRCERTQGGYLISGRWPWASNCENSEWIFVSNMLPEVDGASPGPGWFLTPRSGLSVDQNSWHVSGMQGTGSKVVFSEQPVFVPEHRVIRFSDVVAGTTPGRAIPGNVQAGFTFGTFGAVSLVAPLLGMAQGALTWFVQAMQTKVRVGGRPGGPNLASQSPFVQERAGRASAAIDAAMALLLADLVSVETKIQAGETLAVADRIRIRRDCGFAARQAADAVNCLFEGTGASRADLDTPMQQFWRDANAAARHVSLDVQGINSLVGQHLFGLPLAGMY